MTLDYEISRLTSFDNTIHLLHRESSGLLVGVVFMEGGLKETLIANIWPIGPVEHTPAA